MFKQYLLIFLKFLDQHSVLLSLCHLDSQYIEEDVAHEENAAAENENIEIH